MLSIQTEAAQPRFRPLDEVTVTGAAEGVVVVRDGRGREYTRREASDPFQFIASGALGTHTVTCEDAEARVQQTTSFELDCTTTIRESSGRFSDLLDICYWTMVGWHGETGAFRIDEKVYKFFVRWLRDHVHTLKGMKYYYPDLETGIEMYADTQRDDGMVFDKISNEHNYPRPTHRDHWFGPGGFITKINDGRERMERIPVENDVEYLYLEGLYYTWKATGDDDWMAGLLDSAMKAVHYSTTDEYRWSEKYGLLKRGFTIDTWDFQAEEDAARTGYSMVVHPEKSRFGIMHGDNTGMIAGCCYLAEMLAHVGRDSEAREYAQLADTLKERLDSVCWNGEFFTHHVPEDSDVERDLGVDQSKQVSLSNAYALNRGIDHEQCVRIIEAYRRIREQMPESSPGEFYQIFPPFERGFGGHGSKWEYMNGGVTTIVAGELAHGAFEHGFEEYGADILERVRNWGKDHRDYLPCCLKGALPEEPERSFTTLDLREQANVDLRGEGAEEVPGWSGEAGNDFAHMPTGKQTFEGIPFDVIDPAENGRRTVVTMMNREGYHGECTVPVGQAAASIYFLHTAGGENPIGLLEVSYADGTTHSEYIMKGQHLNGWWLPSAPNPGRHGKKRCEVAWWGPNDVFPNVGCYVYGWDNPEPKKLVDHLTLHATESGAFWPVLGITLCDAPVWFDPGDVSFGIPDNWGAAAVLYALVEGLAGVKDSGVAFDKALVAPRWSAAGVQEAAVTVKYPASGGYVCYQYDAEGKSATMRVAGSADEVDFRWLLPEDTGVKSVTVDGEAAAVKIRQVESSRYVCVPLNDLGPHAVRIELS